MKTSKQLLKSSNYISLCALLLFAFSYSSAQVIKDKQYDADKPETELLPEIFWNVKAYRPNADLLTIKGIDKDGNQHDVKAIQYSEDTTMLDIKLLINGQRIPIKIIYTKGNKFHPVKGIDAEGNLIDIKGVTEDGEILDVKGVSKTGNIVNIRALADYGLSYNVIAISPDGMVNNVKGLKMVTTPLETTINGVDIFAHVKALQQN